jgi:hypothetical protein
MLMCDLCRTVPKICRTVAKIMNKKIAYFCTHKGGAQNALKKAQQAIETNNIFVSAIDLANVASSFDACSKKAVQWASKIGMFPMQF